MHRIKINDIGIVREKKKKKKKRSAGLRPWTKFRLGIEPRTYCEQTITLTTVLTKYPHNLASM